MKPFEPFAEYPLSEWIEDFQWISREMLALSSKEDVEKLRLACFERHPASAHNPENAARLVCAYNFLMTNFAALEDGDASAVLVSGKKASMVKKKMVHALGVVFSGLPIEKLNDVEVAEICSALRKLD